MFQEYDYDAHKKYQDVSEDIRASEAQLKRLKKAQENNQEYIELSELAGKLEDRQQEVQAAYNEKFRENSEQDTIVLRCKDKIEEKSGELAEQEEKYRHYQTEHYTTARKAVDDYERYLANGKKGPGGLWSEKTRANISAIIKNTWRP